MFSLGLSGAGALVRNRAAGTHVGEHLHEFLGVFANLLLVVAREDARVGDAVFGRDVGAYRGELLLVFGLFGFAFELLVLLERLGEFRFEVGSLSGLLLELLVVAFPAAFPAETLVDYAVDFLLGEGPQLRVVHVLWGRRVLFRLLLAVRAGLVFFCHGWWLLCLFLVSTPDAGELTAILVGFAHGCAPPHRWGVKGKRKAITFRRDGFLGFRDFPALFFARIRTAARRSTHSRRRTSASFLRS